MNGIIPMRGWMGFAGLLILVILVIAVIWLVRSLGKTPSQMPGESPDGMIKKRLARGETDERECERPREELRR